jgi:HK97 family phage portal protein
MQQRIPAWQCYAGREKWKEMKIIDFIRKAWSTKQNETAVNVPSPNPNNVVRRQSFVDYLLRQNRYDLAAYVAVQYFCAIAPVDNSISRLFTDISSIPLLIQDKKDESFIDDHPLQQLLNSPNFDDTGQQFIQAFTAFYLITGDSYIIANSIDMNGEPRSLFVIPPQDVQVNQGTEGTIISYQVSQVATPAIYKATPTVDRGMRYIATLQNGVVSEIYHALTLNPLSANYNVKGRSPLTSLFYELEEYLAINRHNLSRLKRGTTLDGLFKTEDKLTDEQYTALQAHITEYWGGENNAGRPFLLEGGLEFQANPRENKDMDFSKMKKDLKEIIYNHFAIPLPFISPETMTLANMEAATLRFYDEGILPLLNTLLSDLSKFLMPRYKGSENYRIWYNQDTISALEPRRLEQLKARKELGIFTINELRVMAGYEQIDGGQNIYGQLTEVPIAVDPNDEFASGTELEQGQQARQGGQQEQSQEQQQSAANVRAILKRYKDAKNDALFSDVEIEKIVGDVRL